MPSPLVRNIVRHLWQNPGDEVYAILDAARDPRVYPAVMGCGVKYVSLYSGALPKALAEVAPYLVRLWQDHPFTEELLEMAWGKSWGVFASTGADMEEVRRHLRRFLRVETEDKKTLVFRYYDPRVLRVYLPTCTEAELVTFFGPLTAYSMESDAPSSMTRYSRRGASFAMTKIAFDEPARGLAPCA